MNAAKALVGFAISTFFGVSGHVKRAISAAARSARREGGRAVAATAKALGVALILWGAPAAATTLTAVSCSYSDVNAVVGLAVDGDTVVVPAGNCAWNNGLAITKGIALKGAGVGQTFITNNHTTGNLITLTEAAAVSISVRGFDFAVGAGPTPSNHFFRVTGTTNGKPVLIGENRFVLGRNGNAIRLEVNRGVIWNNTFIGEIGSTTYLNNAAALRHKILGSLTSWQTATTPGAADTNGDLQAYFEGNILTLVMEGIDVDDNARTVIRHNTIENSGIVHHGDTSTPGGRWSEIYNNTFVWNPAGGGQAQPPNVNSFIALRAGTTVIFNNVIPNITSQAWGDKREVTFFAENLRRNQGELACWEGGYPIPYQVGRGADSSAAQISEPVYLWDNTGAGNYGSPRIGDYPCGQPNSCPNCTTRDSATTYIVPGRDYHLETQRPGYTPYTYPHPLTGSSAPPPRPTNLTVR